ncbi:unnamed protein product [Amoebophrya sp. A120]|nr:unnamed protein product [Amoebophrya sp. A120]|eukprot:GSA120T00005156001.1
MTMSMTSVLDLSKVRDIAREERATEVQYTPASRLVAFVTRGYRSRVNVWYTTGTVGTYIDHPRQGRTQLFRRQVTLGVLREIFRDPRVHTGLGYHFRDQIPTPARNDPRDRSRSPRRREPEPESDAAGGETRSSTEVDEEEAAKAQLLRLKKEKSDLEKEIEGVQAIVDAFETRRQEEKRKQEEAEAEERKKAEEARKAAEREAEEDRKRATRRDRGTSFIFWGMTDANTLKKDFDKDVSCIAVQDDAWLLVHEKARSSSWCGRIPTGLDKFLRSRAKNHPQPTVVALGSDGRYYCEVENGKAQWNGPDSFSEEVNDNPTKTIKCVSFGEDYNTWFIVFKDGAYSSQGNIPASLSKLLNQRNLADLEFVSLGPDGDYFVRAMNGRSWWNLPVHISNDLNKETKAGASVKSIYFGSAGNVFVRGNDFR